MKTVLIFPPPGRIDQPYPSLPALTGFMRRAGYEVVQRDLNIEAIDELLSQEQLARAWERVAQRLDELEGRETTSSEHEAERKALACVAVSAEYVIGHIDAAKRTLRGDGLPDLDAYIWAINLVKRGRELYSALYYPSAWNKNAVVVPGYEWSLSGWLAAAQDERRNPFLAYLRDRVLPSIKDQAPGLVGVSVSHYGQIIPSLTLAHLLKSNGFRGHVCFGGTYLAYLREFLTPSLFSIVDSVVIGEGENALLSLVRALESRSSMEKVPNLIYLDDGRVRANPTHLENVDELPAPDYRGLPLERYLTPEILAFVPTERGCYWRRCAFCVTSKVAPDYRPRKVELVLQDLKDVSRQLNTRCFFLSNDAMPPARMKALAQAISDQGLDFVWETEARLEKRLTPQFCRRLADGGCRGLWLGMESGSQRVLDLMDKGITVEQASRVIHNCYDAGIFVHLTLIAGFPTETYQEAQETLDFVEAHRHAIQTVGYAPFILAPGSKVHDDPGRYGIVRMTRSSAVLPFPAFDYEVSRGLTAKEVSTEVHPTGKRFFNRVIRGIKGVCPPLNYLLFFQLDCPQKFARISADASAPDDVHALDRLVPQPNGNLLRHRLGDDKVVLFDPAKGQGLVVPSQAATLLSLCNGQDSVEQIANHLASTGSEADFAKQYYLGLQICRRLIDHGFLSVIRLDPTLIGKYKEEHRHELLAL